MMRTSFRGLWGAVRDEHTFFAGGYAFAHVVSFPEAEAIIAASHRMHGEWHGNYEEFGFFTGLRPSEQFALELGDCAVAKGLISVNKAVVRTHEKNQTKTNQDREISLCPRALEVLRAHLALREQMVAAGKISHTRVFFTANGEPFATTYLPYNRWREVMESVPVRFASHTTVATRTSAGGSCLVTIRISRRWRMVTA